MTNFQKRFKPGTVKFVSLAKGTALFHGTDSRETFSVLRGPAWLCQTVEGAKEWCGWAEGPLSGGKKRVLRFVLKRKMIMVDTTSIEQWQNLFMALCKTPDPLIHQASKAIAKAGGQGWCGRREVMVVSPGKFLAQCGLAWCAK